MNFNIAQEIAAVTRTYCAVHGIESVADANLPRSRDCESGSTPVEFRRPATDQNIKREVRLATDGPTPVANTTKSATPDGSNRDELYTIRFTRDDLPERYGIVITADPARWARDLCQRIQARGNPAGIDTVEVLKAYGADVFEVKP
jgi:hypothetical protein